VKNVLKILERGFNNKRKEGKSEKGEHQKGEVRGGPFGGGGGGRVVSCRWGSLKSHGESRMPKKEENLCKKPNGGEKKAWGGSQNFR